MATIQGIYVALFGRPADPAGLAFFNEATNNGADLTAIGDLASTTEYQSRFTGMTNEQIINSIYQSLFERDGEAEGVDFYVGELEAGRLNINNIAIAILDGAKNEDLDTVNAKIAAANLFTSHLDQTNEIEAYDGASAAAIGRDYLASIDTQNPGTGTNADAAILLLLQGGQEPGTGGGGGGGGSGGNEPPIPVHLADTINEDSGPATYNVKNGAHDPNGHTVSVIAFADQAVSSVDGRTAHASLDLNGDLIFTVGDGFQDLNEGETDTVVVNYQITDGFDVVNTSATITITGVNDAPTIEVAAETTLKTSVVEGDRTEVGTFTIADVDDTNLTVTLTGDNAQYFEFVNGKLFFDGKADFEALEEDGSASLGVTVNVTDAHDVTASYDVTLDLEDKQETVTASNFNGGDTYNNWVITGTDNPNVITGGLSDDIIYGKGGADVLKGNGGDDIFVYKKITDSAIAGAIEGRDTIQDFDAGDRIDLSAIDLNPLQTGIQPFTFGGEGPAVNGKVTFTYSDVTDITTVKATDLTGLLTLEIRLVGDVDLTAGNFILSNIV